MLKILSCFVWGSVPAEAPVDVWSFAKELPTKEQIRKGFEGLTEIRAKAVYLFTVSTGLRKGEFSH